MNIGENLKILRNNLNLTQEEMAKKLNDMSIHTYRKYEQNLREPKVEMLQQMAEALEISINALLSTTPTKPDFDILKILNAEAIEEAINLFSDDQRSAFWKMYHQALWNLGIADGVKYGDMHYLFMDYLYLSVSFTEIFRRFDEDMQAFINVEKSSFTSDEFNSSIEVIGKYTFETYELLRKNMKILEESGKFYTENPDRPYFEKEIFEKFLDK